MSVFFLKENTKCKNMHKNNRNIRIKGLNTLLCDANSFLPYCVSVCSFTPRVGTAGIMKIWTFWIYLFWAKLHAIPEKQNLVHLNILMLISYQLSYKKAQFNFYFCLSTQKFDGLQINEKRDTALFPISYRSIQCAIIPCLDNLWLRL